MATDQLSLTFSALADPTRRDILVRLMEGEATVNELAEPFPVSVQAVSKHLKVLERAGLITRGRTAQLRPRASTARRCTRRWAGSTSTTSSGRADWIGSRFASRRSRERQTTMGEYVMTEHTLVIEREFDAPRELLWKVWTEPDEIAKWWGPEGLTTPRETIEIDLRPGGVCKMTMVGPDGEEYPNDGTFRVVEPLERLVLGEEGIAHPMIESQETTVEFLDLGGNRSKLVITARMVCAEELIDMANAGWNSQLDKLVVLLAG